MATAHVTGIVALIRERRPHLSAAELIELLHQTQSQTRGVTIASQGVNACRAIAYLVHSDC
jgi:subtilisin family serine protease